jgi:hypothetical protein
MEMQINAAADHGVNVFIYDWYWYDGKPFLEQCLDNGFLGAKNNDRMKFYLMWANHDAMGLWDKRTAEQNNMIWSGNQDEKEWNIICDRIIEKYFSHPQYYKINGKPVFMIYDVVNMIEGLGGMYYVMDYVKGTWDTGGGLEALGWLAVALVIFTSWKPKNAIWGAYLFGFCYWVYLYIPSGISVALANLLGASNVTYMQNLYQMIPYLVTIIVLIIVSKRKRRENQNPASLGISYFREER